MKKGTQKEKQDVIRIANLWNKKRQEKLVIEAIWKLIAGSVYGEISQYISPNIADEWWNEVKNVAEKMKDRSYVVLLKGREKPKVQETKQILSVGTKILNKGDMSNSEKVGKITKHINPTQFSPEGYEIIYENGTVSNLVPVCMFTTDRNGYSRFIIIDK